MKTIVHINRRPSSGSGTSFIEEEPRLSEYEGVVVFWAYQEFVDLPDSPSFINADNTLIALFIKRVGQNDQHVYRIEQIGTVRSWSRPFQLKSGRTGFTLQCSDTFQPGQRPVGSRVVSPSSSSNVTYVDWAAFSSGTWMLRPAFEVVFASQLGPAFQTDLPSKWTTSIDLTDLNGYAGADLLWQYVPESGTPETKVSCVIFRSSRCSVKIAGMTGVFPYRLPVHLEYTVPPSPTVKFGQVFSDVGTPVAIYPADGDLIWMAIKVTDGRVRCGLVRMKESSTFVERLDDVCYLALGMVRDS